MGIEICREIAARIWCDPAFSHIAMNAELCEAIAWQLFTEAKNQELQLNSTKSL